MSRRANCASIWARGGAADHLIVDSARPTTTKTRYVADRQQILRTDVELAAPLAAPQWPKRCWRSSTRRSPTPTSSSSRLR
jgi:hypothetical protein